jgi:pimeloyl-ACP methyl ester carboxylesterase
VLALHGAGCFLLPRAGRLEAHAPATTLTTNGFILRCHLAPAADARWNVVFIHGTPARAGIWHAQFARPFPQANLVAYDRPGFGASRPAARVPRLAGQVAALTNLLAALPARPTILVGHSYGGPVALLAAVEHPALVAGVVLVGASVDPAQERPLWVQHAFGLDATSWVLPGWLRQCNRELLTLKADLAALEGKLPQLRAPVVMVHGARDRQVPVANVAYLRDRLGAAGLGELFAEIVHPDHDHFIPWEHPEAVARALDRVTRGPAIGAPDR